MDADLHAHVERWLTADGDKKALVLTGPKTALMLRRMRGKPGRVGCWVEAKAADVGQVRALRSAAFRQLMPDHWLREVEAATVQSIDAVCAELGLDPASTQARWMDDYISVGQIIGFVGTLAAWLAVSVCAVVWRVHPVIDVFEWLGGYGSPKTAGGAAMITVALPLLVVLGLYGAFAKKAR